MKRYRVPVVLLGFALLAAAHAASVPTPTTSKVPAVDRYHGVEVVDEYRWLEKWDDPEVKAWNEAQNAYARSVLDGLPGVEAIRKQVAAIRKIEIPRYGSVKYAGGKLFSLKSAPPKQQSLLVVMASEDDPASERVVLDPNQLDANAATSIDWYVPSPNGTYVAVSLSKGGSEEGDVHVFETASGKEIGEPVHRVNYGTAGGSLAWGADGHGFYYTRYPRQGERPAEDLHFYVQIYYHRLGTPETEDRYELGKDFPRISEYRLERSPDGLSILANVQNGDSGVFELYLHTPDSRWLQLTRADDKVVHAFFGPEDSLYLLSRAGAPRGKLLRAGLESVIDPLRPSRLDLAAAKVVIPESEAVIESNYYTSLDTFAVTDTHLFVTEGIGGPHRVRIFDLDGKPVETLPLPPSSAVSQVTRVGRAPGDAVLYRAGSYTQPAAWYRWTPASKKAKKTALTSPHPIDLSDIQVVRDHAVSKDGTRVPITILHRKGLKRDGSHPALLVGYGGFNVSLTPAFDPGLRTWFDRGGVYAIANLRGGSEFGDDWHRAGMLTHKQNVFDDFIACAEHLVRAGYANKNRLAIEGGSNGGLLMGAALTQRPELFKTVVSHVGIYDMLIYELDPNGAFTVPEYGTVKDPEQFRALYAYSPYHRVREGVAYPPILFLTGANDPRVNPAQSRKMAARLQAAGAPMVLLRTSSTSGHGSGTRLDERIEQEVDILAFLFDQLKMGAKQAGK